MHINTRAAALPTITLLTTIAVCGCGTNPCDVGLLYENMTPDEQDNCDLCNNANECPDDGETGGDDPPSGNLLCRSNDQLTEPAPDGEICYDAPLSSAVSHAFSAEHLVSETDCPFLSAPVPCERSWSAPWEGEQMCSICNLRHYNDMDYEPVQPYSGNMPWKMCHNSQPGMRYKPALTLSPLDETGVLPNWIQDNVQCGDVPGQEYAAIHDCSPVHIAQADTGPLIEHGQWTCSCADDTDCPIGSVCEAGWVIEGMYPQPTLCTWDDRSGIAPEGPEVYGIKRWSDGISVSGDSVVLTPAMLLRLWPQEGRPFALHNDDQRFDERGTITHCGGESLCEYLGLRVGERVAFEALDVEALLIGEPVRLEVQRPRTRSRWLTIIVRVNAE